MTYMEAHRYLMSCSIRPSVQRTAVMEYLMNHKTHPTVDEIFSALNPTIPTLSKTTVYNTLNLFIEKGAAQMLTIDEKNARYDADISRHAHGYCRSCGKVFDIFDLKSDQFKIPQIEGFMADTVEISFHGVCTGCRGN
jgi:Fe2+ or Zn2+ uptake regulation protein